ncbi:hypothetical protein AB0C76_17415, partial [Kitasatospora sp. NPDC048722]
MLCAPRLLGAGTTHRPCRSGVGRGGAVPVARPRPIEAENIFEGKTFGVGDGSLRNPGYWKYLTNP